MATYSQGRYRFNAATGYWYSGSRIGAGPYNSKPSTKAIMSKSALTSPGGGTVVVTPPTTPTGAALPRPTGTGYYRIEDLAVSQTDLRAAVAKVPAGGTLTLPEGTWTLPDFSVSGSYGLVTASVGIVGSGPRTIITVAANSAVPIVLSGATTASTPTIIRFGGGAQKMGQFTVLGTPQNINGTKYDYNLIMTANQDGGRLFDVLLKGNNGSFNSPVTRTINGVSVSGQGETFSANIFRSNNMLIERVETDGRDASGVKQNATGIGLNNCLNVTMKNCNTHHTGYSHGVAIYRCENVTTFDHTAEYIGTAGGSATAGTAGDGLNCEQSWNTKHYRPRIGYCTLSDQRYYGNADTTTGPPAGGGANFGGDTYPHLVDSLVKTDGQPYTIRFDNLQTSNVTSPSHYTFIDSPGINGGAASTFTVGVTEPTADTSGLPAGWTPVQTISTAQKLTTGNQTFTDVLFTSTVDVQSTGNRFIRCKFVGSAGMTGRPTVYLIHAGCNVGTQNYFERCLFNPQTKNASTDCIMGYNFRTLRCEMTGGVDGSGSNIPAAIGTDARILRQGDYIHDLVYYTGSDTGHSDWHSHNDVNQHHNGTNVIFEGCSMGGLWDPTLGDQTPGVFDDANGTQTGTKYRLISGNCNDRSGSPNYTMGAYGYGRRNVNACFQVNRGTAASGGVTDDIHLINNWFYGGASSINIADTTLTMTTFEVRGNRFEVPLYGKNGVITAYSASYPATCTGNTYMDGTVMAGTKGNGRNNQT